MNDACYYFTFDLKNLDLIIPPPLTKGPPGYAIVTYAGIHQMKPFSAKSPK